MSRIRVYRGLILDLDGTLIDSHAYTFAAFQHACAPYRASLDDAEIYAAFGPDESVILEGLVGRANAHAAHQRLRRHYAAHVHEVDVNATLLEILHACRTAAIPCGLFTGRGRGATNLILETHQLTSFFAAVFAGDDGAPKPAPDGIHRLAEAMRIAVGNVLVVGDSPLDVASATAAGAAARLATWYARGVTRTDCSALRLEQPDELRALLRLARCGNERRS